jgi:hypothetical protein
MGPCIERESQFMVFSRGKNTKCHYVGPERDKKLDSGKRQTASAANAEFKVSVLCQIL